MPVPGGSRVRWWETLWLPWAYTLESSSGVLDRSAPVGRASVPVGSPAVRGRWPLNGGAVGASRRGPPDMEARWREVAALCRPAVADLADSLAQMLLDLRCAWPLAGDIEDLAADVQAVFHDAPDLALQRFRCRGGLEGLAVFDTSMVDQALMVRGILDRLVAADLSSGAAPAPDFLQGVARRVTPSGQVHVLRTTGQLAEKVLEGHVVLRGALAADVEHLKERDISEAPSSPAIFGLLRFCAPGSIPR